MRTDADALESMKSLSMRPGWRLVPMPAEVVTKPSRHHGTVQLPETPAR